MEKNEVVEQQYAAVEQGQKDAVKAALGAAFDAGLESAPVAPAPEVPADTTPFDQAALDAAVAKAAADQKAIDDQVLVEAKADLQKQIGDLGIKLKEKDADALEEAIADKLDAMAKELRDRTVPAPVEQPPVVDPNPAGGDAAAPGTGDSTQA